VTPLELNFYGLVKNYLSRLLASITLADCSRNNFGLSFLAAFLFPLVLILVALLVNLENVLYVGMEIKIFLVFVGYPADDLTELLMCLSLAQLTENLAGLIILFLGLGEVGIYDASLLQTSFCFLANLLCLFIFLLLNLISSYLM
jgi:hypothetical protein